MCDNEIFYLEIFVCAKINVDICRSELVQAGLLGGEGEGGRSGPLSVLLPGDLLTGPAPASAWLGGSQPGHPQLQQSQTFPGDTQDQRQDWPR